MRLGDVVDQLHDQDGLADAGTAEEADLAAFRVGGEQVDHLDAGGQHLGLGRLVDEERAGAWIGAVILTSSGPASSTGSPMTLRMRPEGLAADRHRDRGTGVDDLLAPGQPVGAVHGDGADGRFAEMLGHLEDQGLALVRGVERVQDRRQLALELHVDDSAGDTGDVPLGDVFLG
jgi:hypothetical protein